MEDSGGRKRPREKNGSFRNKPRLVARTHINELTGPHSLFSLPGREARRSDNSDTIPLQMMVDEELPILGVATEHYVAALQCVPGGRPCEKNASLAASWPSSTIPRLNTNFTPHTAALVHLSSLSMLELQHQLIQLDLLEQELLRDLRNARRQYDVRVAELVEGTDGEAVPLHPDPAAAAATFKTETTMAPLAQCSYMHQLLPVTVTVDASATWTSALGGAMPPPPPRPPSGPGARGGGWGRCGGDDPPVSSHPPFRYNAVPSAVHDEAPASDRPLLPPLPPLQCADRDRRGQARRAAAPQLPPPPPPRATAPRGAQEPCAQAL